MNTKINTILPIAICLTLPGIGLLASPRSGTILFPDSFLVWGIASSQLYLMWYCLWFLRDAIEQKAKNSWLHFGLVFLGFAVVSLFITYLAIKNEYPATISEFFFRYVMGSILFGSIQHALRTQENLASLRLEKEQLQTENYRVQLRAIRTTIDPHFLFNSLNTLRSMIRQQHLNSEEFVISLSDFYRQTLKHNENTTISLKEELAVLESYLFVMKNRNEEAINIQIDIDESMMRHQIPTMALQVVVENCFKHNCMSSKKPLRIEMSIQDGQYIQVRNNIQPRFNETEGSGYGLNLLTKRYELMHVADGIRIEKNADYFKVQLKLVET
ncbi:MAG: histidine kinase [Bacteroidota bacterium]